MEKNKKATQLLYIGSMIFCGAIAGIWSFTANRFQYSECMYIIFGGIIAGIGLGAICKAMTDLIRK